MIVVYIVVISLALLLQITFSMLYWKWIPSWVDNPYGRLAQLGAWCHIVFLSVFLSFLIFGKHMNTAFSRYLFISSFFPLIFYGVLQLVLLRRAVRASKEEEEKRMVEVT